MEFYFFVIHGTNTLASLSRLYLDYTDYKQDKKIFENPSVIGEKLKKAYLETHSEKEIGEFNKVIGELVKRIQEGKGDSDSRIAMSLLYHHAFNTVNLSPIGLRIPGLSELIDDNLTTDAGHFTAAAMEKIDRQGNHCFEFKRRYNISYHPCEA